MNSQLALTAVGVTMLAGGCPQQTAGLGGSLAGTTLTSSDQDAIAAAVAAFESATNTVNTTQNVAQEEEQTALDTGCPTVEFSASNTGGLNLAVSVDFGDSCTPSTGFDTCGGTASGTLSALTQTLTLNFESLNCDSKSLNGVVEFGFATTESSVSVTGDWDIAYTEGESTVGLDATGEATFDFTQLSTTFVSLTGVIDDNGDQYACEASNVVTSYFNNDNFIPESGEIALSGNGIKNMTVIFDADSPSTGTVQVSINGGEPFTYNLFEQD
jgi:hypothetical protein